MRVSPPLPPPLTRTSFSIKARQPSAGPFLCVAAAFELSAAIVRQLMIRGLLKGEVMHVRSRGGNRAGVLLNAVRAIVDYAAPYWVANSFDQAAGWEVLIALVKA